jgi:hypothetical protein
LVEHTGLSFGQPGTLGAGLSCIGTRTPAALREPVGELRTGAFTGCAALTSGTPLSAVLAVIAARGAILLVTLPRAVRAAG